MTKQMVISVSDLLIVRAKCTLTASHTAQWWVTVCMPTEQTDRPSDGRGQRNKWTGSTLKMVLNQVLSTLQPAKHIIFECQCTSVECTQFCWIEWNRNLVLQNRNALRLTHCAVNADVNRRAGVYDVRTGRRTRRRRGVRPDNFAVLGQVQTENLHDAVLVILDEVLLVVLAVDADAVSSCCRSRRQWRRRRRRGVWRRFAWDGHSQSRPAVYGGRH